MASVRQWTQWLLTAVLLAGALLLAVRTWTGPLTSPIHLRSPLNVESAIGLAATLLLLLGVKTRQAAPNSAGRRFDAVSILVIATLIAVVFWRSTGFYFLSDDFILLKQAKSLSYGFRSLFATAGADGSYRPITHLFMSVAYTWAGTDPSHWHWIELALHTANSILVLIVARMLGFSRFGAAFAATLFAVHGTRPEAVVWLAGRADLLAAFFVLLGLASFIRFWNHFWNHESGAAGFYFVSLLSMTLAILCKESAYSFSVLLVVLLASKSALTSRRALYALTPFVLVTASLLASRILVLGGLGGYRNPAGQPEVLSLSAIAVVKALVLRLVAVSFFPINWSYDPNAVVGIVLVLYLASLVWLTRVPVEGNAVFLSAGFLFVLALPALPQLLIGADLQKARLLYLPAMGFCLMLAAAVEKAKPKAQWVLAIAILTFNITALLHNLSVWKEAATKARAACGMASACPAGRTNKIAVLGLPRSLNGVYFFANGFKECIEMQRNGDAAAVDRLDAMQPEDRSNYACILSWDIKTGELLRVPYDIH